MSKKVEYDKLELKELNYDSYLKVGELLELQQEVSDPPHHDEMFFIIIHQASELWFKEILHETKILKLAFREQKISKVLKALRRIVAIMDLLVKQIAMISTLTPVEFAGFRDKLTPASGFQSSQFRIIEYTYGIRNPFFIKFFQSVPETFSHLSKIQKEPSVYDDCLYCLKEMGYDIPDEIINRDFSQDREMNDGVIEILKNIYENPQNNFHLVLLFETMLDFDEKMKQWRSTHVTAVSRTIGMKKGTGGSSGFDFLQQRIFYHFFPELWEVRNCFKDQK